MALTKSLFRVIGRVLCCLPLNCYTEMVRNNVSLTVELVFVNGSEGFDQKVSICFSILSKSEGFH